MANKRMVVWLVIACERAKNEFPRAMFIYYKFEFHVEKTARLALDLW
jgi:hypothetical protein